MLDILIIIDKVFIINKILIFILLIITEKKILFVNILYK